LLLLEILILSSNTEYALRVATHAHRKYRRTLKPPSPWAVIPQKNKKKVTTIERGKHYQLLKSIAINRERERERGRYAGCFSQHTRSTKCTKLSTIGKLSKKKI
jgi:hypothetical protein